MNKIKILSIALITCVLSSCHVVLTPVVVHRGCYVPPPPPHPRVVVHHEHHHRCHSHHYCDYK